MFSFTRRFATTLECASPSLSLSWVPEGVNLFVSLHSRFAVARIKRAPPIQLIGSGRISPAIVRGTAQWPLNPPTCSSGRIERVKPDAEGGTRRVAVIYFIPFSK